MARANSTVSDSPGVYTWTGGIIGDGGAALDIAAVDLYANGSSSVYYDDLVLDPISRLEDDFDFYLNGKLNLDDMVSQRIKLEGVNDAFSAMERGEVARSVITFD